MPTFSIMNGMKHMCMYGFHVLPTVFRGCVQRIYITPQHRFCSLCPFLPIFLPEYVTVKVKNKAETASLICVSFGGIDLFVMQNSIHKCSLKDLIRDLHCVFKCH